MRPRHILLLLCFSLITTAAFAKGHGGHGGHGGHSGAHSSHAAAVHQGGNHSSARSSGNNHAGAKTAPGRSSRRAPSAGFRTSNSFGRSSRTFRTVPSHTTTAYPVPVVYPHDYYVPAYTYGGYYPGYGNPYLGFWSVGIGFINTPNYGYYSSAGGSSVYDNGGNGAIEDEALTGYVVYARDTLVGTVSLTPKAVFLEKSDSGHQLDYKFRIKQKQLTSVAATNEDNKQLSLVRLPNDHKKLWRVVHEGLLNIYDDKVDFIYRPDDIDIRNLVVVYQGKTIRLASNSPNEIKDRLTGLVNAAYDLKLDAKKLSWNELLIYIDKLN